MKIIKIGRNPDNNIVITDETRTVSGYHAILKVHDNGILTICDNSTNGIFINGLRAIKDVEVSVRKGDKIRLGPKVELDWSKVDIPAFIQGETIMDNDEKKDYTIGTASDNRIVISDPTSHVSRHHAILKLKSNGNYYIHDQSTNGTYVNGVKVKPRVDYPVSTSDTISLSSTYHLDWNKIPNVLVPKSAHEIQPQSPKPKEVMAAGTEENGSKLWNYILYAGIFFGVVYFSYYQKLDHTAEIESTYNSTENQTISGSKEILPHSETTNNDISTLYEQNKNAVFVIYTSDGTNGAQGSGFFISSRGVAVSNYHVFKGSSRGLETIKTTFGSYKVESVLAMSEDMDYIVFQIAAIGRTFPFLKIAGSMPRVGEDVFAIGAPEGLEHTLSKGIVSSYRGKGQSVIQTTTEITHGSSGGPLFNMQGEVIGITTAGLGDANLNFAVSIVGLGFEKY